MKIIVRWILLAAALLLVANLYSGVQVTSFTSALIAALVLGLFNTLVRPLLVLLTLPVTLITLGLLGGSPGWRGTVPGYPKGSGFRRCPRGEPRGG